MRLLCQLKKGWNAEQMKVWIGKAWCARLGSLWRSLLVYDVFQAHIPHPAKASFKHENTDLAVKPGGLTSILQPLDVSLNRLFKDEIRKKCMQWMTDRIHQFTTTGWQKKPSEEFICSWISEVWNDILLEMIMVAFLKCRITNKLDGMEGDLIYNSTKGTDELDNSFVKELFASDS